MREGRERLVIVCIGLIAVTMAAYWSVVTCSFVNFDDKGYVYGNQYVLNGLSWAGWKYAWTSIVVGNWQPVTMLSLEIDGSFWGLNPTGYHVTNLLLHVVNSVLLFFVLREMTQSVSCGAFVAALFALHPMHVESVAWISERKDVLSTFFLLLTIAAYLQYAKRPSWLWYLVVAVLYGIGLLAKPMLVTLPILLLLLDGWPLNRIDWSISKFVDNRFPRRSLKFLICEKLPLLGMALADGLMAIAAQGNATIAISGLTLDVRIAHAFYAYCWYLQKTFVPTGLTIFYPHPERTLSWLSVGIGALIVVGITGFVLRKIRSKPHLLFGWAWFVIALLPVIGLLQVGMQAYADRYVYVPHIGLFLAVIWEVQSWTARSNAARIVGAIVMACVLIVCGFLTNRQVGYWKDSEALWNHALEVVPDNHLAHFGLGDFLSAEGKYEQAIEHLELGVKSKRPDAPDAYCNWGRCLLALDRPAEAEQKFREALKIDGFHEVSLEELSKLLVKQNRHAEAARVAAHHEKALASHANKKLGDYTAEVQLGLVQARQGNIKQAAVHFEKAVRLAPHSAAALNNLASAQFDLQQYQEAKSNFLKALERNNELAGAHYNLAIILESEKDVAGAKKHFAEAYRIDPNDAEAKQHLERLSKQ